MRRNIKYKTYGTKLNQRYPGKSTYELEIIRRRIESERQSECRRKYQNG